MTQKYSLTVDKEFIQYCKLNNIEDVEKAAKETFKRGFDLLKYGSIPESELTKQDKSIVGLQGNKTPVYPDTPKPEVIPKAPEVPEPKIVEAKPLKSSDAGVAFREMGVVPKKKEQKRDLYDE